FVEIIQNRVREIVRLVRLKIERIESAEDAHEISETRQHLRRGRRRRRVGALHNRTFSGRADEGSGAGADTFNRLSAETSFFYINSGSKIFWHKISFMVPCFWVAVNGAGIWSNGFRCRRRRSG